LKIMRDQEGQATVEFLLTSILIFGITFFFFQLSFIFAYGSFVHYATFMSARAYLSAGYDIDDQEERARSVIVTTLKKGVISPEVERWPAIARGVDMGDDPEGVKIGEHEKFVRDDKDFSWLEGVRYTFKARLFIIPMGLAPDANVIELTSETWLSRHPTEDDCRVYLEKEVGGRAEIDNGC